MMSICMYRLVLRCRQLARKRFAALREDVLAKIELLENKHVHDVVSQLHAIASQMASYNRDISRMMLGGGNDDDSEPPLFPIEMDLTRTAFQYESVQMPANEHYQDNHDVRRKICVPTCSSNCINKPNWLIFSLVVGIHTSSNGQSESLQRFATAM